MDRWGQFNAIIRNENLSTTEKTLLLLIFSYHNPEKGYAFPSMAKLMKEMPIANKSSFLKVRKSLVEKGFLTIETVNGIGCKYFVNIPSNEMLPGNETIPGNEMIPTPGYETIPGPGYEMLPQKEKEKKKEKKNIYIENQNSVSVTYMDLKFIDDCITNIKITEEQYEKLKEKYPIQLIHDKIEALDNYKKLDDYKDQYKALLIWCKKDKDKEEYKEKPKRRPKKDPYASIKGDCTEDKYAYLKPKDPPAWVVDWT